MRDLCELLVQILLHRSVGTVNAASGRSVSFRELAERVAGLSGRAVEVVGTPRANPITHRRFDTASLQAAFPAWRPTDLPAALAASHRELTEGADGRD